MHGPDHTTIESEGYQDWVRTTIACVLQPGEKLRVVKYLTYSWSSRRSLPALRDQVGAALAGARLDGWDGLHREQRNYLDAFWDASDVLVEGDPEVQQAVRFGLFHVLQAGARAEQRPISAKGLTGPGYDGHAFWDTEMFVLPVLTYTQPSAVRSALQLAAQHAGLGAGAGRDAQPAGAPPSPGGPSTARSRPAYWPAGTAAFHIAADIADAVRRYVHGHRGHPVRTGDRAGAAGGDRPAVALARPPRPARAVPHRRGHRPGRVHRREERQRLHQPDGAAEPARRRRRGRCATGTRRSTSASPTRRPRAGGTPPTSMHVPYDEELERPPAGGGLHPTPGMGLHAHTGGEVPAAAALPVLRAVPQAGGEAGRPGPRHALARGRLHPRGEGAQLPLLRAPHRTRLVVVGVHPGGARRRGGPPRTRAHLPARGRADGPARPQREHPRRRTHGVVGRRVARPGQRVRRSTGPRRRAVLRPPALQPTQPVGVLAPVAGAGAAGGCPAASDDVLAAPRRPGRRGGAAPPRPDTAGDLRRAGDGAGATGRAVRLRRPSNHRGGLR